MRSRGLFVFLALPRSEIQVEMNQKECTIQISENLKELGIKEGDTILVHSSFKSLGPVPSGIETLIQGFLLSIGTSGTLLMPALCWDLRPPRIYDVKLTPVNVGAIPEYFRNRLGAVRSVHPTHSVAAIGKNATKMLSSHFLDQTPCGPHSPFTKLIESNAKIVMLGCGLKPNTTMHAIEESLESPRFLGRATEFTIKDLSGEVLTKEYFTHDFSGFRQRYDRVMEYFGHDFMCSGNVLNAKTYVIDANCLRDATLEKLKHDPYAFVEKVVP